MTRLEEIEQKYLDKLTDIKYEKAVSLLGLLSDDDYAALCEDNAEFISPISTENGEKYLHRQDVLDKLIELLLLYIENAEPDPSRMNEDELNKYIESLISPLDVEGLRNVATALKTMLED